MLGTVVVFLVSRVKPGSHGPQNYTQADPNLSGFFNTEPTGVNAESKGAQPAAAGTGVTVTNRLYYSRWESRPDLYPVITDRVGEHVSAARRHGIKKV